jgi:hypothetical protein
MSPLANMTSTASNHTLALFKSRFPAANIPRRNEIVATDTFFSDVPAHDDGILGHGGSKMVQLYCGTTSLITAIFPMRNESEMPGTLLDFIRKLGAPNGLFSDNAKVQIGKTIQTILRMYCIEDMQSEPHHQHQNPAERRIQDIKKVSNHIMDRTGTPSKFWLLSLLHTVYILNRLSTESLDWLTPYEKLLVRNLIFLPSLHFIGGNQSITPPQTATLILRKDLLELSVLQNTKVMQ